MLKFSFQNSKIVKLNKYLGLPKKSVVSFDLPAGYTCPAARLCKSFANQDTGKVTDAKGIQFRCYAVSSESAFPATRRLRWHNFNSLKGLGLCDMVSLILESIPDTAKVIRVHSSGDFFSYAYFLAWVTVASIRSDITFFGYTKMIDYVKHDKSDNFHLVYSYGGKFDNMVTDEPVAYVVMTVSDAVERGLKVSCQDNPVDDYDYIVGEQSFALVIHGTQPAMGRG